MAGKPGPSLNLDANDLSGDKAQALIRELLARNQALEQQLQQQRHQGDGPSHAPTYQPDVTPEVVQEDQASEPEKSATLPPAESPKAAKKDTYEYDREDHKSRTCVDCDKTFPTLKALNRCSTCYQRLYKRCAASLLLLCTRHTHTGVGVPWRSSTRSTTQATRAQQP